MNLRKSLFSGCIGLTVLSLAACAGYPRPSGQRVAAKQCEHSLGSLLCGNDDDNPSASMNSAAVNRPSYSSGGSGGH